MSKRCPFCGSEDLSADIFDIEDREGFPTCVTCDECGCRGPWAYIRPESRARDLEAAAKLTGWNDRKLTKK